MINKVLNDELKTLFPLLSNSFLINNMIQFQTCSYFATITYQNGYLVKAYRNKAFLRTFKTKIDLINFLKTILL